MILAITLLLALRLCACANSMSSSLIDDICAALPDGSVIREPGSCTNWIQCRSSVDANDYDEGSCLSGLFFDKNAMQCRPEEEVRCPFASSSHDRSLIICRGKADGIFLADPNSCTGYIYCNASVARHSECPAGLNFSPEKGECVFKDDYNCIEKEDGFIHEECLSISDSVVFSDRQSCVAYHRCNQGQLLNYTCDNDLAFDRRTGNCLPIESAECLPSTADENSICGTVAKPLTGYISDGKTCSGYYRCAPIGGGVDRNPTWDNCPNGRFFDAKTLSCKDRTTVSCPYDRCEGMGNKYVNIAGDCQAYGHCRNDVQVTEGKCPKKYFFDEKSQSCSPKIVQYAACS